MKKYILLAGVALATMTANNVMANGVYYDVKVEADIVKLTQKNCSNLDFGFINIISRSGETVKVTIPVDGTDAKAVEGEEFVTLIKGASPAQCVDSLAAAASLPETVKISNTDGDELLVSDFTRSSDYYTLGATLTIDDIGEVTDGHYTGSFTTYFTY